jgi:sugar lactone lactonase YvrE
VERSRRRLWVLRVVPARVYGLLVTAAIICGGGCLSFSCATALAALPDGRVYEAVTPVASEGHIQAYVPAAGAQGYTDSNSQWGGINTARPFEVSPDGETVVFPGDPPPLGGGGAIGQSNGDEYVARRLPGGGWSVGDIQPPGSPGEFQAFSDDLSTGFLSVFAKLAPEAPANCQVLYARSNGDGVYHAAFTTPQTPAGCGFVNAKFFGQSTNSADLIFASETALIPNAVGAESNLYESVAGKLSLINVLPDGEVAVGAAFGSPKEEVGNSLREPGADNVLSADGSRVLWTDKSTGDLYVRENPTQPQSAIASGHCSEPGRACTVELSASEKSNGSGPAGTDPDGPKPVSYWGAGPDGSKVLFTSSEELTNSADTGPTPAIGRAGLDGTGAEQSFIPAGADGVAVDGSHIYWANPVANTIGRANLDGTGVEQAFITGANKPQALAVDASHIYWSNAGAGREEEGTIARANLDGSGAEQSFITGASDPEGLAVDATHLYWANAAANTIARANLDGSGGEQSFISAGGSPSGLAVDSAHVYWTIPSEGSIGRAALAGGEEEPSFITGAVDPEGLAVDSAHLYWANAAAGTIARANLDGSGADESFITGASKPEGVAVDAAHLYWADNAGDLGSDLYRADTEAPEGGRLTDLTPGGDVQGLMGTSGDGSYIYFVAGAVLAGNANGANEKATAGSCKAVEGHNAEQEAERQEELSGQIPPGRACNLYLLREGQPPRFIATLPAVNDTEVIPFGGSNEQNHSGDWQAAAGQRTAAVTPDGRNLTFMSNRSLTGYPNQGLYEVFLYDADSAQLRCISCNPGGEPPVRTEFDSLNGPLAAYVPISKTLFPGDTHQVRGVTADGSKVFFDSAEPLVAQDTNGWIDVYEWERDGTGSCGQSQGCIYLLSGGSSPESSWLLGGDANGENVFIITRAQLLAQDKNENDDVYDLRVNGVRAPEEAACSGSGCQTPQPAPQTAGTPSSVTFAGAGNFPPPAPAVVKPKPKPPTRAQLLAKALKACRAKHDKHKRSACERQARKRYGAHKPGKPGKAKRTSAKARPGR